ncbi:hypothetical protein KJ975_12950 [Myxococcota bacterium]|nr:hypothetical protein [Myxococcota bacterium]
MPQPIAICLEDCYSPHESLRFLQCVAGSGPDFRLLLAQDGRVLWQEEATGKEGAAWCRIFVTGDQRLGVIRDAPMPAGARVSRAGRRVDLEPGKPVILMEGDYVAHPGRCYRVHIHGAAARAAEPTYLQSNEPARHTLARLAAAGIIAVTALTGAGCPREQPVNEQPEARSAAQPQPVVIPDPPVTEPDKKTEPIETRLRPPDVAN